MNKSKKLNAPVETTESQSKPSQPSGFNAEAPPVVFGNNTVWIGAGVLKRLVEETEAMYPDDDPLDGTEGYPAAGLRQVEDALVQFKDMAGLRARLIFGPPAKPLHELDLSEVPTTQGQLDNDDIQQWIHAGASLIADARELT